MLQYDKQKTDNAEKKESDRLQGCFVGAIEGVGSPKHVENSGSGDFWVKIVKFSTFWCFFMKPADAGRDFEAITIVIDAGDPAGRCNSKTTCNSMLFWYPMLGGCNELAYEESVGGRKSASLGGSGLV